MSKGRVLITERIHPVLRAKLENYGFDCTHIIETSQNEVLSLIAEYDGLVVRSGIKGNKSLMDAGERLKFIARAGSGMDLIDLVYAKEKGIVCLNSPEGNKDAVAEQAIGMLLSLLHHIARSDRQLRDGKWSRLENRGTELGGKTVGIIGYGNTGSAFAMRLLSFGVRILAYDKYRSDFGNYLIEEVDLEHLKQEADVISFHIPLNEETRHIIDAPFLKGLQQQPLLLNTSRGGIMNTVDVLWALNEGYLSGAGLDVFENERWDTLSESELGVIKGLQAHGRVVMTPHTAGVTFESFEKVGAILADKIIAWHSESEAETES